MLLFTDYVQPLTNWIYSNPEWALVITFLISFAESLAVIGSIVPGSVTMTAIGILAGSGVMRIDLTLTAAILGAIAGDSASYFLGYYFKDSIANIWPFKKYPHWLNMGKEYFEKHGGKSVLIGRFIGPLRAIIPVIAGMMQMKQLRFFFANFISAIGWSLVYLGPGIAIGAASNELSAESATRLFLFVLLILVLLWLLGWLIKFILVKLNRVLSLNLNEFWQWSKKHPFLSKVFKKLTPPDEINNYPTAAISCMAIITCLLFLIFILIFANSHLFHSLNMTVYFFLNSLSTKSANYIFLWLQQLSGTIYLFLSFVLITLILISKKYYKIVTYLFTIIAGAFILVYLVSYLVNPNDLSHPLLTPPSYSFSQANIAISSAFYLFIFLLSTNSHNRTLKNNKYIFISIIPLTALAGLYLGNYWLTDIIGGILIGSFIGLLGWLFYRREGLKYLPEIPISSILIAILLSSMVSLIININQLSQVTSQKPIKREITLNKWWNNKVSVLPTYRYNRLGDIANRLNIQYIGSLDTLNEYLSTKGWRAYKVSLFASLLNRMSAESRENALPLLTQLYNNQRPVLILTKHIKACDCLFVIRLWNSNYVLKNTRQMIYLGTIHTNKTRKIYLSNQSSIPEIVKNPLSILSFEKKHYKTKVIKTNPSPLSKSLPTNKSILLVHDKN